MAVLLQHRYLAFQIFLELKFSHRHNKLLEGTECPNVVCVPHPSPQLHPHYRELSKSRSLYAHHSKVSLCPLPAGGYRCVEGPSLDFCPDPSIHQDCRYCSNCRSVRHNVLPKNSQSQTVAVRNVFIYRCLISLWFWEPELELKELLYYAVK